MQNPPAGHHAAAGDDHGRAANVVERLRFVGRPAQMHIAPIEDRIGRVEFAFAEVVVFAMLAIDGRGVAGHRAVEVDRQVGNAALPFEHLQQIDQLLRAADGKRGDQHHAAAARPRG